MTAQKDVDVKMRWSGIGYMLKNNKKGNPMIHCNDCNSFYSPVLIDDHFCIGKLKFKAQVQETQLDRVEKKIQQLLIEEEPCRSA